MKAFTFQRVAAAEDAARAVAARPGAMFLAGGTTLVDLMKVDVLTPDTVVDVRPLGMSSIDVSDDAIAIGATVTNSQLAWHPVVRDRYPVLSEAILSGATTQTAQHGDGCRQHPAADALLRISETCTRRATADSRDPAAMRSTASTADTPCWASANTALPRIHPTCAWRWPSSMPTFTRCGPMAPRVRFRLREFHRAPGDTPHVEVALEHGELITHIVIPHLPAARRSHYLKVRDRASYEFALASAAVVLDLDGDTHSSSEAGVGRDRDHAVARDRGRALPDRPQGE